jgi:hypothetical protein
MKRTPYSSFGPYALLGAMTLVAFGGPFLVLVVVRGGTSPDWPPDRPFEWFVITLVLVLFTVLFAACLTNAWWFPPPRQGKTPPGS